MATFSIKSDELLFLTNRKDWRKWLLENYKTHSEVWLVSPLKGANEVGILYNDAVEEALCFGWIDGIHKSIDNTHSAQRFTPRKEGSPYSRLNIERLIWLNENHLIQPDVLDSVLPLIHAPYVFPTDIIEALQKDESVWNNYVKFPKGYQRIRIAYIDAARHRKEEFTRRLESFIEKTRKSKLIVGYGGTDKYYK